MLSWLLWVLWITGLTSGILTALGGIDRGVAHAVDAANYLCGKNPVVSWTWHHTCEAVRAQTHSSSIPALFARPDSAPLRIESTPSGRGPLASSAATTINNEEAQGSQSAFKNLASFRIAVGKIIYEVEGSPLRASDAERLSLALSKVDDAAEHASVNENQAKAREFAILGLVQTSQIHIAEIIDNCQGLRTWIPFWRSQNCGSPIAKDEKQQSNLILTSISNNTQELSDISVQFGESLESLFKACGDARSLIAEIYRDQRMKFQWSSQWSKYYFPGGKQINQVHEIGLAVLEGTENVLARGQEYVIQTKDQNRLLISEVPEMERELSGYAEGPYLPREVSDAVNRKLDRMLGSVVA